MKKLLLLAVLALLGSAHQSAQASLDGTPSTGSYTVITPSALAAATATGSITVVSTQAALGIRIAIGPNVFTEGIQWRVGTTTATAATSLKNAINALVPRATATSSYGTISLTAIDSGALYNSVSLRSSTPSAVSVSGANLTGGQDNAMITINGVSLRQGTDWFINDTASGTATSIATAINRDPKLSQLIEAMPIEAQVYLRAKLSPNLYSLATSAPSALSVTGAAMTGGSAGNLARFSCNLGVISALPTANYPKGCIAYLDSDPTKIYISTENVVGLQSWLGK